MDQLDGFGDFEFDEMDPKKLIKVTKQGKKAQKDILYQKIKPEKRLKFKMEKKERHQQQLSGMDKQQKSEFLEIQRQKRLDKKVRGLQSLEGKLRIVVDCAFEELMEDRETKSLARQIAELYAFNRSLIKVPAQLYITNIYPKLDHHLEVQGSKQWQVQLSNEEFYDIPELQNSPVVYLTPDALEDLETVDENTIYVVGGLVDRKIVKNATLNRANLLEVQARRLPIGDFIKANFKVALNVSTAALMIPEYLHLQDWEKTFISIVPDKFSKKLEESKKQQEESKKQQEESKKQQEQIKTVVSEQQQIETAIQNI